MKMITILPSKNMDELVATEYNKRLRATKQIFRREYQTKMRYERYLARAHNSSQVSKFTYPRNAYQTGMKTRDFEFITPPPIEGRVHVPTQTSAYLEELSKPVEERDAACQADSFIYRPSSPLFVPAKTGIDVETQIEEGELFDFETEVLPILDAFVAYTLEQSLLEVIQEEELAELREQQRRFEELHICELAEKQFLAEKVHIEQELQIAKQGETLVIKNETPTRTSSRNYIMDLIPTVFQKLEEQGFCIDGAQQDIEEVFWPWLMNKVDEEIMSLSKSSHLLDLVIKDAVEIRSPDYRNETDESHGSDIIAEMNKVEQDESDTMTKE